MLAGSAGRGEGTLEIGSWVGKSALLGRRRAAEVGEDANSLPRLDPPSRLLPLEDSNARAELNSAQR